MTWNDSSSQASAVNRNLNETRVQQWVNEAKKTWLLTGPQRDYINEKNIKVKTNFYMILLPIVKKEVNPKIYVYIKVPFSRWLSILNNKIKLA